MPLPVIAISNASTCLTDAQVEAVLPALQKQVSDDFKAYWELDCTLTFLNNGQPLTRGGGRSLSPITPIKLARWAITK